jgi:hypothetical protein
MPEEKKTYLVPILLVLLTVCIVFIAGYFLYKNVLMVDTAEEMQDDDQIVTIEVVEQYEQEGNFDMAVTESIALLSSGEFDEADTRRIMKIATDLVSDESSELIVPYTDTELVFLFIALYDVANNPAFSNELRASAYAEINRILQSTEFDMTLFKQALEQFDDGAFIRDKMDVGQDPDIAIAYSGVYELNKEAEMLYPDRYNKAWQVWSVGNAMVESPTPAELEDDFIAYIKNELAELEGTEHLSIDSEFQRIWIDQALLVVEMRLAEMYPEEFSDTMETLGARFASLLSTTEELGSDVAMRNVEYIVRIGYADFLYRQNAPNDEIDSVLRPLIEQDMINAPGVFKWITNYDPVNEDDDYLLERLYGLSLEHAELRSMLELLGWVYEV